MGYVMRDAGDPSLKVLSWLKMSMD